ncbi:MAG TPA: 30S ribosomal protein S6, partial [Chloroflexota bacterium]|nr:30S ribosomal protein S6 [Chloroflexota bacterium]
MRDYELSVVIRPDIDDKMTKVATDRVQSLITQRGGELNNVQDWGKRRMAYKIGHHGEGIYFIYRLQMEPASAAEIEHELNLDEQVLRFIMVHLDPVALEVLRNPPPPMAPRPERRPMEPPAEVAVEAPAAEAMVAGPTGEEAVAAPAARRPPGTPEA